MRTGSPRESWETAGELALGRAGGNRVHLSRQKDYGFAIKPKSIFHFAYNDYISKFFFKVGSCLKYSVLILDQLYYFLVLGAMSASLNFIFGSYNQVIRGTSCHRHRSLIH